MLDEADQDELQAGPTGVETGFSALISGPDEVVMTVRGLLLL